MGQITANAMAWAGFRSAGGIGRSLLIGAGYGVVVVGVMFMLLAANTRGVYEGTPRFMLGAQIFIMGVVVCGSIVNTIQKDGTSKIIESHRLMPIPPRLAVLGYIAGAVVPFLPLAVANFVIGGLSAGMAGLPIDWWVSANVVVLTFCAFLWTIAAGAAFYGSVLAVALAVPIGIMLLSGGAAGVVMPSILMLTSPVLGRNVFSAISLDDNLLVLWAASIVLQFGVGWVCIEMGARRFRSADLPPLSAGCGVLLVAILAVGAAVVVNHPDAMSDMRMRRPEVNVMATSAFFALMVASAAVIASVVASERIEQPLKPARIADRASLLLVAAIVIVASAFAAVVPVPELTVSRVLWTAGVFLVSALMVQVWMKWSFAVGAGFVGAAIVLLAVSLLPTIASVPFLDQLEGELSAAGRIINQVSPMAMIVAIWSGEEIYARPESLIIQAAIVAAGLLLLWRRRSGVIRPMIRPVSP